MHAKSCDIFCTVVDNYGDIGVCWRLARQLVNEQGLQVRLWVDDLHSFGKLCPELDVELEVQTCRGVEIHHWGSVFAAIDPADLVMGAFACEIPKPYIEAMALRLPKSVWLNLEYLSAEEWVEGCHQLPSPHPTLPLSKYFFFPGFTAKTGGLLLEHDLLERRDSFQAATIVQDDYWRSLGVPQRESGELRVSLFSYENAAIPELLDVWGRGSQRVTCLLPEGRVLPQVQQYFENIGQDFSRQNEQVGKNLDLRSYSRGNLRVFVLPFVEQENYDKLLWACDINFVRGEDSCVRAQWAGRPFIWHIYSQHDGVHLDKLEALRTLYTANLPVAAAQAVRVMWLAWNGGQGVAAAWRDLVGQRAVLESHGKDWAQRLSRNSLALNLLDFSRQVQ